MATRYTPSSGAISFTDLNYTANTSNSAPRSLNDPMTRVFNYGSSSGSSIDMNSLYNKNFAGRKIKDTLTIKKIAYDSTNGATICIGGYVPPYAYNSVGTDYQFGMEIRRSTDGGVTWTDIKSSFPAGSTFRSLFFLNGRFILSTKDSQDIASSSYHVYVSTDGGVNWTNYDAYFTQKAIDYMDYGGGYYAICNSGGYNLYWSSDLITWSSGESFSGTTYFLKYANNKWYMGTPAGLAYTTAIQNGVPNNWLANWTYTTITNYNDAALSIGYITGKYFVRGSTYFYYSTDGINFTSYSPPYTSSRTVYDDATTSKFYLAFKMDGTSKGYQMGSSSDGLNWSLPTPGGVLPAPCESWGGFTRVVRSGTSTLVGWGSNGVYNSSTTGTTTSAWTYSTNTVANQVSGTYPKLSKCMAYNSTTSTWATISYDWSYGYLNIWISTDRYNWTSIGTIDSTESIFCGQGGTCIVPVGNGFAIITSSGTQLYIYNGSTVTKITTSGLTTGTDYRFTLTYGNGVYIAKSSSGGPWYSTDGTTWTLCTLPAAAQNRVYSNIIYTGTHFLWHCYNKTNLWYSTNGSTWSTTAASFDDNYGILWYSSYMTGYEIMHSPSYYYDTNYSKSLSRCWFASAAYPLNFASSVNSNTYLSNIQDAIGCKGKYWFFTPTGSGYIDKHNFYYYRAGTGTDPHSLPNGDPPGRVTFDWDIPTILNGSASDGQRILAACNDIIWEL